ncbi:hypothetical protein [Acuticoccus kandeliae]|uniref:hypothetical protein n=1 Tax=Acuticoccus kandeliae TaxID=2073160 RepID=UPI0013008380|nr:hypothetical protein [Acuticoccus kandeliae]
MDSASSKAHSFLGFNRKIVSVEAEDLAARIFIEGDGPVTAWTIDRTPFTLLAAFDRTDRTALGTILVVPPISGVLPTIMREMVRGLLPDFRVLLLVWRDPREIPLVKGPFRFADNIEAIVAGMRHAGPGAGLVSLCQSGPPAFAATAHLCARDDPAAPIALAMLGAPIDPAVNPTSVSRSFANASPIFLRSFVLTPVPFGHAGVGRMVYSAEVQWMGYVSRRSLKALGINWVGLVPLSDMGEIDTDVSLMDLADILIDTDGTLFIENIDTVYRNRAIARGKLRHRGAAVDPAAIRACPLLTIEGAEDSIVGAGQTQAAHALCTGLPAAQREHVTAASCNHLGLFRGPAFRTRVLPPLLDFLNRRMG